MPRREYMPLSPGNVPFTGRDIDQVTTYLRVTRPNDTTAYAAGDVWGAAGDARLSTVVPSPINARSRTAGWGQLTMLGIRGAPMGAQAAQIQMTPFFVQPATVIGDNSPIALSDADLAERFPGWFQPGSLSGLNMTAPAAGQTAVLSQAAGVAGRSGYLQAQASVPSPIIYVPGSTIYFYLVNIVAYTPSALETLDLSFTYSFSGVIAQ